MRQQLGFLNQELELMSVEAAADSDGSQDNAGDERICVQEQIMALQDCLEAKPFGSIVAQKARLYVEMTKLEVETLPAIRAEIVDTMLDPAFDEKLLQELDTKEQVALEQYDNHASELQMIKLAERNNTCARSEDDDEVGDELKDDLVAV
jgi:hypothetical protein